MTIWQIQQEHEILRSRDCDYDYETAIQLQDCDCDYETEMITTKFDNYDLRWTAMMIMTADLSNCSRFKQLQLQNFGGRISNDVALSFTWSQWVCSICNCQWIQQQPCSNWPRSCVQGSFHPIYDFNLARRATVRERKCVLKVNIVSATLCSRELGRQ